MSFFRVDAYQKRHIEAAKRNHLMQAGEKPARPVLSKTYEAASQQAAERLFLREHQTPEVLRVLQDCEILSVKLY